MVDSGSNRGGLGEIKGSVFHGFQFACGDKVAVNRGKAIRMDHYLVVQIVSYNATCSIEVDPAQDEVSS